jgi:NADPH:quinone reductase-like Zn-dependent oxidoreductase
MPVHTCSPESIHGSKVYLNAGNSSGNQPWYSLGNNTDGAGFDVVSDSVGGANMTNSFEAAALNGHVTTTVSLLELDLTPAHSSQAGKISSHGSTFRAVVIKGQPRY